MGKVRRKSSFTNYFLQSVRSKTPANPLILATSPAVHGAKCYNASSALEDDMRKFEIVHDKVRTRNGDARQWLVYVDGVLRAEATSQQSAKDFVAIERAKSRHT